MDNSAHETTDNSERPEHVEIAQDALKVEGTTNTEDDLEGLRPIEKGGEFICPWKAFKRPGFNALRKWKFEETNYSNVPTNEAELNKILPILQVDLDKLKEPVGDKIQVTWIGHATVLVQFDGICILSDPVFSEVCSPVQSSWLGSIPGFSWLGSKVGYKRYRSAACIIKDIPKLDAVIISHNHYDHLDNKSVKGINEKFPDVKWFVASNTKEWFTKHNVQADSVTELSWWEEGTITVNAKQFTFICTPAQHWCQRGVKDLNTCLWCGWAIKGPKHSYYFAGDTGYYEPLFKKIGEKYGPFSIAAIPIGAYEPRWMMEYQHIDPEEAVKIHKDIKSEQSIGIHWGTFELTNEFYIEPPMKLSKEMKKAGLDTSKFTSLCHGETWVVGEERDTPAFMDEQYHPEVGEERDTPPFMDEQYHPKDHGQEQPKKTTELTSPVVQK